MTKIKDCTVILDKNRIPLSSKERENLEKIYPYYGAQGIIDYVDRYLFDGDYLLVAEDGNNLKSLSESIVNYVSGKFWVNNHAHILGKRDGYDLKYIFYKLKTLDLRGFITGSAQPKLNQDNLANIDLDFPDMGRQQKIAKILSTIDDKIELNNKINSELEAMAKELYEYWFVQFDFPDENGKPYKSSGGKMVWNDELKREIPEGWEVKTLGDIMKKNTKGVMPQTKTFTIDLSIMPSGTMCLGEKNSSDNFSTNLFEMKKFDILFGGIRPYLKKAGFAPCDGVNAGTVHSFSAINEYDYNLALLTTVSESMFNFAIANSKGTKMPVVSADDLLTYRFPYSRDISIKFNDIISFREIIANNIMENHQLSELRDFLLPMLMNGQVTVR